MSIKRINQFPEGSGSLSNDDVFLFMDDPSGSGITKKISLSQINAAIGGGGGGGGSTYNPILPYENGRSYVTNDLAIYNNDLWFCFSSANLSAGYAPPSRPSNWKKIQNSNVIELGSVSGSISTDASLGSIFDLTLAASGTIDNPSNPTDGQTLRWRISHGANSLTINLGNKFQIPSTATSPLPFSATSGTLDLLGATYDYSRDKWDVIAFVSGY